MTNLLDPGHDDLNDLEQGYFSDEDAEKRLVPKGGLIQDADSDKPEPNRRALCWSMLAMAMSVPALIGA